ncbi:Na+/H+ antiporter NhaA [Tardiphaga sp. vice352]|uniref:Na+/H+ antiporter NhaA n=1 Tax=unclassified Tardiphaga TaxID=2631404 RepID=UPI001165575D|nr:MULTISPECIES: Na+/H+ antiporter NhaA [unclassified Tardiphaga]QDM16756.1 Na+/H+ antiporter NhaA [Tardiphaga sp. vice278]QDM21751.1 Na+/H+ antiporter NhaA [Tardiphaga sp. vice154]QDM26933.1 Na+/H+ antiporter NhaA [Tardiphaga sp. vice304]QDM32031.1 Na+/H+ antiporter NhaA [Tardiphaga sp. vice352]
MNSSPPRLKPISSLRHFMTSEAGSGVVLMLAAAAALIVANSPASPAYFATLQSYVAGLSVLHWINDALMAVFFLFVGLEIKREFMEGQLATWPRRVLPGFAALGGMIAPAAIYLAFNGISGATARGWAIPTATDIAFALGALALLGSRVPVSLKIFLTALAILDDLGAITIIALFYTDSLAPWWLAGAAATIGLLLGMSRFGVRKLTPYLVLGVLLWLCTLKSGVHATLAGVALALTIPLPRADHATGAPRPLLVLEHALQPWVAYLIVPVFGFANAGVSFAGMKWSVLLEPVTIGVTLGLFAGKQAGVLLATWLAITLKVARLPDDASWAQMYGVALLCGIGFTMSLFIGILAFPLSAELQDEVKVGVLAGSLISGALGMIVLAVSRRTSPSRE